MCINLENMAPTQETLHLLLPLSIGWIVQYIVERQHLTPPQAIVEIYTSQMYAKLEVEETKLWRLGPVALYEMLCDEKGWPRP